MKTNDHYEYIANICVGKLKATADRYTNMGRDRPTQRTNENEKKTAQKHRFQYNSFKLPKSRERAFGIASIRPATTKRETQIDEKWE